MQVVDNKLEAINIICNINKNTERDKLGKQFESYAGKFGCE